MYLIAALPTFFDYTVGSYEFSPPRLMTIPVFPSALILLAFLHLKWLWHIYLKPHKYLGSIYGVAILTSSFASYILVLPHHLFLYCHHVLCF